MRKSTSSSDGKMTGTAGGTQDKAGEEKLLKDLQDLWQDHQKVDLKVRYETGRLLNERLGSPEKRQPYGQQVVKLAAEKCGLVQSDLSRMRRFAASYKSFDEASQAVRNWTQFKESLSSENRKDKNGEVSSPKATSRQFDRLLQSLNRYADQLREVKSDPGEGKRKKLLETFQKFAKALPKCLCIRMDVKLIKA